MAVGATVISGAFTTAMTAAIDEFLTANYTISGSQITVLPDANNAQFYLAITESGGV